MISNLFVGSQHEENEEHSLSLSQCCKKDIASIATEVTQNTRNLSRLHGCAQSIPHHNQNTVYVPAFSAVSCSCCHVVQSEYLPQHGLRVKLKGEISQSGIN